MPREEFDDEWKDLVEVHNHAKALFLLCEEMEPNQFRSFLQPFNELRHAYEHVIRSKANQLQLDKRHFSEDYQRKNLQRALGHEYRGFFDCADWLGVILRDLIQKTLSQYSTECICTVLPDYYREIKPKIIDITEEIAKLRGSKDIGQQGSNPELSKQNGILEQVRHYRNVLQELQEIYKRVEQSVPSLTEFKSKKKRETRWHWFEKFAIGLAVLVAGAVIGRFLLPPEPPASLSGDAQVKHLQESELRE